MGKKTERKHGSGAKAESRMIGHIDELNAFEEFKESVLPQLRADLRKGLSAEQIYKKYQHLAAARNVTIALTEADSSKALAAVRDILDRSQGKAKERQEVTHKLEKLPEDQLDALILSKAKEMGLSEEEAAEVVAGANKKH